MRNDNKALIFTLISLLLLSCKNQNNCIESWCISGIETMVVDGFINSSYFHCSITDYGDSITYLTEVLEPVDKNLDSGWVNQPPLEAVFYKSDSSLKIRGLIISPNRTFKIDEIPDELVLVYYYDKPFDFDDRCSYAFSITKGVMLSKSHDWRLYIIYHDKDLTLSKKSLDFLLENMK